MMAFKIKVKMKLTAEDLVMPAKIAAMEFRIKVKLTWTVEDHALPVVSKQHYFKRNRHFSSCQ